MKTTIIGILLLVATGLFGQTSEWQKCGQDDHATLNQYEVQYFNEVFAERKAEFDFDGKKIAYYTGSSGTTNSKKSDYFKNLTYNYNGANETIHEWQAGGTQLLILTDEEKDLSGGYDAILVYWSKLPKQGKSRTKLVKRLRNTLPENG